MKLLFVEDEFYTRNGILQSIDWAGLGIDQVECASNSRESLEKLSLCPDILLTDIRMPYVTGLDIARELKQNDPDAEVITLSSYSDKEYLFTAISLSVVSYIEKPVQLPELTQALTQAVGRRRELLMLRQLVRKPAFSSLPDAENPAYRHSTRMALQLISQCYSEEQFNVNTLAEELHLTPVYLTTSFREDTGCTIKRMLTDVRIAAARQFLATTNLSIGEIAPDGLRQRELLLQGVPAGDRRIAQ